MLLLRRLARLALVGLAAVALPAPARAQVTTSSMAGTVRAPDGAPVAGATVQAVHVPSGTSYTTQTRADGRWTIAGMRVGGPYTVRARLVGYEKTERENLFLELGVAADVGITMNRTAVQLTTVSVTAEAGQFSAARTGAATRISKEAIEAFPTIGRTLTDFTRLTPQSTTGGSFAGLDNRFNNIQLDGSTFNNSFGLSGQPGGRTGVSPIPLEAVDQIQVSIAPYDVRQGNFTGAGVNAVTKSGTNNFSGSVYWIARNQDYVGTTASGTAFNPGTFNFSQVGVRLDGPVVKNKLFFFVNYENDKLSQPGTTFLPNPGGQPAAGSTTRVLKSDLDSVASFLRTKFNYDPGAYQGYNLDTPSERLLLKLDWNADERNKVSFRYARLTSSSDQLPSNSNSLGFGNRRTNLNSLSFSGSDYAIMENIDSYVAEWNAQLRDNLSNNLIVGYTSNDESRAYRGGLQANGSFFPTVDILQGGVTYMSFGFEPFTPFNQLRYKTFQAQDNVTIYAGKHDLTFGAAFEKYNSENVFYPGSQSVYVYNSLADFFTDANGYLTNPSRTTAPVTLNTFQVRYNNIPGQVQPVQPLEVYSFGAYAQDNWHVNDDLNITYGLRVDMQSWTNTTFRNGQVDTLTFRDQSGNPARFSTSKLPDATPLLSPRVGFSWFLDRNHDTRIRGGTGIFTGKPAFVWISNQVGNNGVITGFSQLTGTTTRPFNPNPQAYFPASVTGAPASSYEVNFTDPNFKFPQLWRSNLGIDRKLPGGFIATVEGMYSKDVNGMFYYNANLPNSTVNFTGVDQRPRWAAGTNRAYPFITAAYVLSNQNVGYSWSLAGSLEKSFQNGFFAKVAYNYGEARNTVDPGSIAGGTWTGTTISGNPNQSPVAYSSFSPGHRYFVALSYRKEYFKFGATTVSFFGEGVSQGIADYTYSGDLNGDGGTSNDLIYIPRNQAEMNFKTQVVGTTTYTPAQQAAAWDAYIAQDPYLSTHRGQYMERGGILLPMVFRADVSLVQEFFTNQLGKRNNVQVRLDILNVGNLLNNSWGTGQRLVTNTPLISQGADGTGAATYYLRVINGALLAPQTLQNTVGFNDVYRFQLSLRYSFF